MTERPTISARLLFDSDLIVACLCAYKMTVTRPAVRDDGPLNGEHGRDGIERRCENCNVQIDISIDA